jgi:short-subunit dehydrogenase/pimeloyl-ACP methyl ester carboxylesterase
VALPAPGKDRAAIVTGASSGIGEAMARELAARGHQLVLVARNAERLHALAADLGPDRAHVLLADLSSRTDRAELPGRIAALGLAPDVLINNAGVAVVAQVAKSVPEQQLNLVEVDVAAVVDLCSRFLPGMMQRGRGAVLNVSSLAGFGPLPGQAAYGAAKAFVLSYTESLRSELRGTGVTVTTLCPGPVATGLDDVAGFIKGEREAALPRIMWKSADEVARAAMDGLAANKSRVIPGRINRLAAASYRIVPHRPLLAYFARRTPRTTGYQRHDVTQRGQNSNSCPTQGSFHGGGANGMLEVIDKGAVSDAHPAPLLFVHGAWHAAWCWDEYFLSYFADKGYRALAVSFRGHGNSPIAKPLRSCTVNDYVADVKSVADSLSNKPVVIGHSMGGLIVQKYLESNDAPAGVLMASIPPQGNYGSSLRWIKRHPWHAIKMAITGDSLPYINTAELAREKFFSAQTPESDVLKCAARLQGESKRVSIDCLLLKLPRPKSVTTPLLVLGAEEDGAHTQKEVRATGRAYRTEAEFFPAMGHNMMLEPGWEAVAERIDSWLCKSGL